MKITIQSIKKNLYARINQLPIDESLPLYINQTLAGYIHPCAIKILSAFPEFQYYEKKFDLVFTPKNASTHDNADNIFFKEKTSFFNKVAITLREHGLLPYWRDEQVIVWNNHTPFAHIERAATRPLGLLTKAIHLNAWTPDGKIYLSLRAPTKYTDPNKWDTLAGGLLSAEDTPETGLARESYEEAGIPASSLQHSTPIRSITFVNRPLPNGYQYEEILASDCILPSTIIPCNMDGEVSDIKAFSVQDVVQLMQQGKVSKEAMVVLLDSIESSLFTEAVQHAVSA